MSPGGSGGGGATACGPGAAGGLATCGGAAGLAAASGASGRGAAGSDTAGGGGSTATQCDWGDCYPGYSGRQWCGDGMLAVGKDLTPSEACDDGNMTSGDGCAGDCMSVEPGFTCTGPGWCAPTPDCRIVDEKCLGGTPIEYGLGCTADCQPAPYCGDGIVQSEHGELCDAGPPGKSPYGGCTWECKPGPYCGDGTVDGPFGEACDDGQLNGSSGDPCSIYCRWAASSRDGG